MGCNSSKTSAAPKSIANTLLATTANEAEKEGPTKTLAEYVASVHEVSLPDLNIIISGLAPENRKKLEDALSAMEAKVEEAKDEPIKDEPVNAQVNESIVEDGACDPVVSTGELVVEHDGAEKNKLKAEETEDEAIKDEPVVPQKESIVEEVAEGPVVSIPVFVVEDKSANNNNSWLCCK